MLGPRLIGTAAALSLLLATLAVFWKSNSSPPSAALTPPATSAPATPPAAGSLPETELVIQAVAAEMAWLEHLGQWIEPDDALDLEEDDLAQIIF